MATIISTKTSGVGGLQVTGDASGVLQLASNNGTTAVTVDASQNVGIGTSSPTNFGSNFKMFAVQGSDFGVIQALSANGSTTIEMMGASGVGFVGTRTNHPLALRTNDTERMRIDSGGTVFMGQITNPATATLVLKVPTGTANGVNAQIASNTGTSYPWSNYNATGTYVGGISCTSSATAFPTSSDVRLKKNIENAPSAIDKVLTAEVVSHDWINDDAHVEYGFIAQDLQKVIPQAVIEGTDKEDGSVDMPWGVDYSKIVPLLTKAIQELKVIVDTKSQMISDLTERIAVLEAK